MKGNLPLPLKCFTYISQLHGFLQNVKDSQFQIRNYLSPKHSRSFATDCEWYSTISQIRSKNMFLFEKIFSVGKTFEVAKLLQNAYEMVLSPKYSVFSRIKRFYFKNLGTFSFLIKIEYWRRKGCPELYCIASSEKHLFRSWSCLAADSLVSAISNDWKKNIYAKDDPSYPLFAISVNA